MQTGTLKGVLDAQIEIDRHWMLSRATQPTYLTVTRLNCSRCINRSAPHTPWKSRTAPRVKCTHLTAVAITPTTVTKLDSTLDYPLHAQSTLHFPGKPPSFPPRSVWRYANGSLNTYKSVQKTGYQTRNAECNWCSVAPGCVAVGGLGTARKRLIEWTEGRCGYAYSRMAMWAMFL